MKKKEGYKCSCGGIATPKTIKQSMSGKRWNLNACYCSKCKTYFRVKQDILSNEFTLIRLYRNGKKLSR